MAEADACPIPNAHRRLEEAHRLWHRAAEAYEDPDEFRTQLNALIQALRNVTWVLQKEKRAIPDFESWYSRWQETMKQDEVMRWSHQARTVVVHMGDLETHSTATAAIQASWDVPETRTFEVPPLIPALAVAAKILVEQAIPDDIRKQGILTVERRWVADDLPELEILDALAHCFGILSLLIADAHRQAGASMHTVALSGHAAEIVVPGDPSGRPPCMIAPQDMRTVRVHLADNEIIEGGFVPREAEPSEEAKERYGVFTLPPPAGSVDPLEWAPTYMEHAKHILQLDKYHSMVAFLFGPKGPSRAFSPRGGLPRDQQEKYSFMNDLAVVVRRTGATGVVVIADAWVVHESVEIPEGKRPADMVEDRIEALQVVAAKADGSVRMLATPYTRAPDGTIEFGETIDMGAESGLVFLLPVMQAWGLPGDSEQPALQKLRERKKAEDG
jgi:hypothetical protein